MNKNALIVFTKNPVVGKVKTRLAKDTGAERALEIYKTLLENTYNETKKIDCEKFLFLSDNYDLTLFDSSFVQIIQSGNDLGEKMKIAFEIIFAKNLEKAVLIGTDCPELKSNVIKEAYKKLSRYDIVIGPSKDGGYYLLGLKEPAEFLFENIKWGSDKVLQATINKITSKGKKYFLLKELRDLDDVDDLRFHKIFLSLFQN